MLPKSPLLFLVPFLAACSSLSNCPEKQAPKTIPLRSDANPAPLMYVSAPISGPLDAFPAQSELVFVHNLGARPEIIDTQLSFSATGIEGGEVTENAGSQGEITCVDDKVIVVKNGTCEKAFYIRVTAQASGKDTGTKPCELDPP